jgi:hypothetical protein
MIAPLRRFAAAIGRDPLLRLGAIGLGAGALGFAVLGTTPRSQQSEGPAAMGFELPTLPGAGDAQAVLAASPLWASQPAQAVAAVEPPPRLVGIVDGPGATRLAVFEWPDGRRARLGARDTLPGQGVIAAIDATSVRWRNAEGQVFEARLYLNPEPRALPPRTPPPSP